MSEALSRRAVWLVLGGLLIALALPQFGLGARLAPGGEIGARLAREGLWWAIAAALLAWVLLVEKRPLSSIGLKRPGLATFGWALAGMVALMASVMLSFGLILPALGLEMNRAATGSITALPLWLQLAMFVRAGIVEEILYRGYPIERLTELTGSPWLAATLPGLIFIGAHYAFWGGGQLIVVAFGTLILTLLCLWRGDLICCMIAHAATDTIGFTLARLQS